jgi:tRNA(Leu) C34 or U34 (ribose-2'-O)-methylase TrmL
MRQAGLDYWDSVDLKIHESWADFSSTEQNGRRFFFTRAADVSALHVDYLCNVGNGNDGVSGADSWTAGEMEPGSFEVQSVVGDCDIWSKSVPKETLPPSSIAAQHQQGRYSKKVYLIFGSETSGFPDETEAASLEPGENVRVALPMLQQDVIRCYNVATSATMAAWDAFRQLSRSGA